jgi:hypothetical protein
VRDVDSDDGALVEAEEVLGGDEEELESVGGSELRVLS